MKVLVYLKSGVTFLTIVAPMTIKIKIERIKRIGRLKRSTLIEDSSNYWNRRGANIWTRHPH